METGECLGAIGASKEFPKRSTIEFVVAKNGSAAGTVGMAEVRKQVLHRLRRPGFRVPRAGSELTKICSAPRPARPRGRAMEVCAFLRLLIEIVMPGRPAQTWLGRAKARLDEELDRELDPAAVASEVGMRYESFRKRFTQAAGLSPVAYRNARRLETARELLTSSLLSIRQIAANLGHCDEYHVSRRFREARA